MQSPLASTSVVPPSWKLVWMPWETSLAAWIGKPISALTWAVVSRANTLVRLKCQNVWDAQPRLSVLAWVRLMHHRTRHSPAG